VVAELFSSPGDGIWNLSDDKLVDITACAFVSLGLLSRSAISDSRVDRWPRAYPLYEIGYRQRADRAYRLVRPLSNAALAGRNGMFRYHNIDHAIQTGWQAAVQVLGGPGNPFTVNRSGDYHER